MIRHVENSHRDMVQERHSLVDCSRGQQNWLTYYMGSWNPYPKMSENREEKKNM